MKYKKTCINCEHWDLYCTLGKEEYYWCRIWNFNRFELKESLKIKQIRGTPLKNLTIFYINGEKYIGIKKKQEKG